MFNSNGHQIADCGPMSPPDDESVYCPACGDTHEYPACREDYDGDPDLDGDLIRDGDPAEDGWSE